MDKLNLVVPLVLFDKISLKLAWDFSVAIPHVTFIIHTLYDSTFEYDLLCPHKAN